MITLIKIKYKINLKMISVDNLGILDACIFLYNMTVTVQINVFILNKLLFINCWRIGYSSLNVYYEVKKKEDEKMDTKGKQNVIAYSTLPPPLSRYTMQPHARKPLPALRSHIHICQRVYSFITNIVFPSCHGHTLYHITGAYLSSFDLHALQKCSICTFKHRDDPPLS